MDWTGVEAVAYLVAAAVQSGLAGHLALRRPRREWSIVLAALFAVNALVCAYRGLLLVPTAGLPALDLLYTNVVHALVHEGLEIGTSFLLAYVFLLYPTPPRWAQGHPWRLRLAVLLPAAVVWAVSFSWHDAIYLTPESTTAEQLAQAFLTVLPPAVIWVVVLLRGAAMLRSASPLRQQPLALLYAAVGLRAAHVSLLQFLLKLDAAARGNLSPGNLASLAISALPVAALVAATVQLTSWRLRAARPRHATLALGFLGVGVLLAFPFANGTFNPDAGWPRFITHLDLYVVRPALVWGALVPLRGPARRVAAPLLALFVAAGTFAAALTGFAAAFTNPVMLGSFAVAVAAAAAVAAWLLGGWVIGAWSPDRLAGRSDPADLEAYLDALEDALRTGERGPAQARRLDALRRRLGVTPEQDEALRRAVQHAWRDGPSAREWRPTDQVLGRYAIAAELGEGACGKAFLARDLLAGEEVVLKRTRSLDPRARRTLLAEAAALQRLDSPRIVRHLRTEQWGGEPVLVLQHMAGGSLADRLRSGPLPLPAALRMAEDVLEGLAAAHAAGIVHCDLKPANILFTTRGRAALADFGIATTAPAAPGLVDATRTSLRPGSLRYMSPEQARGLPAEPRSDLHAVAMTLLTSLLGAHPLEGHDEFELRQAIAAGRVPVPGHLPPALRRLLRSALSADPAQRPASATAMLEALRRVKVSARGRAAGSARLPAGRLGKAGARRPAATEPS